MSARQNTSKHTHKKPYIKPKIWKLSIKDLLELCKTSGKELKRAEGDEDKENCQKS